MDRLDRLAFMAHPALTREDPSRLASGNYGFLDAIAALRWIQQEIAAFGGDPCGHPCARCDYALVWARARLFF